MTCITHPLSLIVSLYLTFVPVNLSGFSLHVCCFCVSVSVCLRITVAIRPCICLSLSVCLRRCLRVCLCLCLYLFVSLSVCLSVCLFVCLSLPLCLSVCLFLSLSVCVSVSVCLYLSLSPSLLSQMHVHTAKMCLRVAWQPLKYNDLF